jgi:transcription elongation factor Elf1
MMIRKVKVNLSPYQAMEAFKCVSCELRTSSSSYKKVKIPRNRSWNHVGVFGLSYEHHPHMER